jgi:hypothetical protein
LAQATESPTSRYFTGAEFDAVVVSAGVAGVTQATGELINGLDDVIDAFTREVAMDVIAKAARRPPKQGRKTARRPKRVRGRPPDSAGYRSYKVKGGADSPEKLAAHRPAEDWFVQDLMGLFIDQFKLVPSTTVDGQIPSGPTIRFIESVIQTLSTKLEKSQLGIAVDNPKVCAAVLRRLRDLGPDAIRYRIRKAGWSNVVEKLVGPEKQKKKRGKKSPIAKNK